jgi:hypothetical protein
VRNVTIDAGCHSQDRAPGGRASAADGVDQGRSQRFLYKSSLFPRYVQNMLTRSVVARPLRGEIPMIELVMGYSKSSTSPVLKILLARTDKLIARVSG